MKMLSVLVMLATALGACMADDKTYVIDGVPVVLEYGEGPEREHMALAVGLYREAATEHWAIDGDLQVWRAIREIRWTAGAVDGQALYHYGDSIVYANWYNCALDVPLYSALAEHYAVMLGDNEDDSEWAEDLQDEHEYQVCSSVERKRQLRFNLPW